ncbi:hypothetical protein ACFL07_00980 [Pseudomonadota bacterium]
MKLFSTTYKIEHKALILPYTEIWQRMLGDIDRNASHHSYELTAGKRLSAVVLSSRSAAGNSSELNHYSTINAEFLKDKSGCIFVSLQVGNLFTDSDNFSRLPNDELNSNYSKYRQWVRNQSCINLQKHLSLIREFVNALIAAGWKADQLAPQSVDTVKIPFKNSRGVYFEEFPKSKALLRNAFANPDPWELRIICRKSQFKSCRKTFISALQRLFPNGGTRLKSITHGTYESLSPQNRIFGVIVLSGDDNLECGGFARELEDIELVGAKFRLVREETLKNIWAIESLLFDLYLIAGGIPWVIDNQHLNGAEFVAMDAGHLVAQRKSRWASVRYDVATNDFVALWRDTDLGEHLSISLYRKLLSIAAKQSDLTVYRDGRYLSERTRVQEESKADNQSVFEVIKHPRTVTYRSTGENIEPAKFGDVFSLPNGHHLIQTQSSSARENKNPLKIISLDQNNFDDVAFSRFLSLCSMPLLSLNNRPRLPAPIYWADLISKLDTTKWAKAVGRGFKLAAPTRGNKNSRS